MLLIAAGLVCVGAVPASATPPSSDLHADARDAAAWLAHQVNGSGFIPQAADPNKPNLGVSAQAVTALAAAGVGKHQVDALLAYLGAHVDDFVVNNGADDPAALAYLILAARAGNEDATSFGPSHTNLVTRLVATQQGNGLFGAADPTFDGAFREGLALLALHAVGESNTPGVTWLEGQQCTDGSWTAFRADTSVACPPVDPATFTGPDTNSTAVAALGLDAQGASASAAKGIQALDSVRNSGGGWGFLARSDQATDGNSTGLVLAAERTVQGTTDNKGLAALVALQVGCNGDPVDRGGIAFQPGKGGAIVPDPFATDQALLGLSGATLPLDAPTIASTLPAVCASTTGSTVTTAAPTTTPTTATTAKATVAAAAAELPRTGSSTGALWWLGLAFVAVGTLLARRRR
jgi:LPXTG-motif cell wall-anchored protein